jgi:hypothetical protein
VEILLSLLILAVGLMGVLVLFPLGIDAARISAETTRSATIARLAEAELFYVNGPDHKSPFQRIVERARSTANAASPERCWLLPHFDEILDPDIDGDSVDNGREVQPVLTSGTSLATAEYGWSITVAYPYVAGGTNPDYVLNDLWQNPQVFVVQVTVYRKFGPVTGRGNFAHNSIVIDNLSVTGVALESVRSGAWVRYLDPATSDPANPPYSDGFWYRVDQVDVAGRRVKLNDRYWGREGTAVPLEVSDRIVGAYTFLLSAN